MIFLFALLTCAVAALGGMYHTIGVHKQRNLTIVAAIAMYFAAGVLCGFVQILYTNHGHQSAACRTTDYKMIDGEPHTLSDGAWTPCPTEKE